MGRKRNNIRFSNGSWAYEDRIESVSFIKYPYWIFMKTENGETLASMKFDTLEEAELELEAVNAQFID